MLRQRPQQSPSLRRRLVRSMTLAFFLVSSGIASALVLYEQKIIERIIVQRYAHVLVTVADLLRDHIHLGNWALADILVTHRLGDDEDILYAMVNDHRGVMQINLRRDHLAAIPSVFESPVKSLEFATALPGAERQHVLLRKIRTGAILESPDFELELPLFWADKPLASLRVGLSHRVVTREVQHAWSVAISIIGLGIIMIVATTRTVAKRIAQPLSDLSATLEQATVRLTTSDPSKPLSKLDLSPFARSSVHEVAELALIFERMQSALNTNLTQRADLESRNREIARLRAVAQTTQMLAHDVRKPFSMLRSVLLVLRAAPDLAKVKDIVEKAQLQLTRSLAQVDAMLSDIMEASGDQSLRIEPLCLTALLEDTLRDVILAHRPPAIRAKLELNHSQLVKASANRLTRAITNVLANALDAMNGAGELQIETQDRDDQIEIRIKNNGPLIPAEHLAQIFDAFFTRGKPRGTGLGLAIVRKIIVEHGGDIRCESNSADGVIFFINMPAGGFAATPPVHKMILSKTLTTPLDRSITVDHKAEIIKHIERFRRSLKKSPHAQLRILVVDDDTLQAEAIAVNLRNIVGDVKNDLNLQVLTDPQRTWEALQTINFDLLISDVDLQHPEISGIDLVRMLRDRGAHTLRALCSSGGSADAFRTAIEAGADRFFVKPLNDEVLVRLVADAAEKLDASLTLRDRTSQEIQRLISKPLWGHTDFSDAMHRFTVM